MSGVDLGHLGKTPTIGDLQAPALGLRREHPESAEPADCVGDSRSSRPAQVGQLLVGQLQGDAARSRCADQAGESVELIGKPGGDVALEQGRKDLGPSLLALEQTFEHGHHQCPIRRDAVGQAVGGQLEQGRWLLGLRSPHAAPTRDHPVFDEIAGPHHIEPEPTALTVHVEEQNRSPLDEIPGIGLILRQMQDDVGLKPGMGATASA